MTRTTIGILSSLLLLCFGCAEETWEQRFRVLMDEQKVLYDSWRSGDISREKYEATTEETIEPILAILEKHRREIFEEQMADTRRRGLEHDMRERLATLKPTETLSLDSTWLSPDPKAFFLQMSPISVTAVTLGRTLSPDAFPEDGSLPIRLLRLDDPFCTTVVALGRTVYTVDLHREEYRWRPVTMEIWTLQEETQP